MCEGLVQCLGCFGTARCSSARIKAASTEESGAWLHALPMSSLCLRMDDETVRAATGPRLGVHSGSAWDLFASEHLFLCVIIFCIVISYYFHLVYIALHCLFPYK